MKLSRPLLLMGLTLILTVMAVPERLVWGQLLSLIPYAGGYIQVAPDIKNTEFAEGSFAGEKKTLTVNGVDYTFCWCPPGEFEMGSPEAEEGRNDDETRHHVTLTRGFWLLESEVTQEMWLSVMGTVLQRLYGDTPDMEDWFGIGPHYPMHSVSWYDASEFCLKLSKLMDEEIVLPTEAQWEYACRAGGAGSYAGTGNLDEMGWHEGNCNGAAHPFEVKGKEPNAWGLYDMHGNVWEWCSDWWGDYPETSVTDPLRRRLRRFMSLTCGAGEVWIGETDRIIRGGGWQDSASACRAASRGRSAPKYGADHNGFRPALIPAVSETVTVGTVAPDESEQSVEKEAPSDFETPVPESVSAEELEAGTEPGEKKTLTVNGVDYTFRWCPPGEFTMGSPESELGMFVNSGTQHHVKLTHGFWMLESEVTQEMWENVMGTTIQQQRDKAYQNAPISDTGDHCPMYYVNWEESGDFCRRLSELSGEDLRLPTEAEWEYACRAGATGSYAGTGVLDEMGWYSCNSNSTVHGIKEKETNSWGLYDMHSSVWEWCGDRYGAYDNSEVTDPAGPGDGLHRVIRGGDWNSARFCRSTFRFEYDQLRRYPWLGFRFILVPKTITTESDDESPAKNDGESSPGENNVSADEDISENTVFDDEGDVIIEGTVLTRFNKDVSKYSIPDSVTEIGEYAFAGCSSLTEINIPESITKIGMRAFADCSSLTEINISDSVTEISMLAFEGCSSLAKINIPDSVTKISENAFEYCSSLTKINIPDSVTEIGWGAFEYCSSLTEINIPDSVAEIGQQAFEGCSSLAKINIPNSVTKIGMGVFSHCSSLTEINVSSDNSLFHCEDGVLFEGTVLHTFLAGKDVQSYNIPDFVTEIGGCAFCGCSSLTKINIPDSVTEIGWGAFEYCSSLSEINIPKSVTKIGGWPFHRCSSLPEIKVSAENPVFHDQDGVLFEGTVLRTFPLQKNVSAYSIPESTTKISAGAFIGCSSLTEVNIPESVTEIDRAAFEDCTSLTKINIPESVIEIGDSAFRDCPSLTEINIPKSVTEIENWTFGGCSSLTAIQIPESVTEIHDYAFCGCHSLTKINIPDGITKIGDGTFESCSSLSEIRIPNSVTEIGMSALSFCTSLEKVYAPKDIDLSKAGIRDSAEVIRY